MCGQTCQDRNVAYAIDNTFWLINNEDLSGIPSGAVNKTATCPLGGTVQIVGTTTVASNGIETLDLTLTLQNCGSSKSNFSLTFTGGLQAHGTFGGNQGTGANAVTMASSSLIINGTVRVDDQPSVQETCPISLTDTYDPTHPNATGWLNGALCGRGTAN
jgi:hypothetical protein